MMAEIKALDPKPGLAFEQRGRSRSCPDVLMRPHADGGWHVELNNDTLPRVLVNQRYYARVSRARERTRASASSSPSAINPPTGW